MNEQTQDADVARANGWIAVRLSPNEAAVWNHCVNLFPRRTADQVCRWTFLDAGRTKIAGLVRDRGPGLRLMLSLLHHFDGGDPDHPYSIDAARVYRRLHKAVIEVARAA